MPIGVVVFPGAGIRLSLADKAGEFGLNVLRFDRQEVSPSSPDQIAPSARPMTFASSS